MYLVCVSSWLPRSRRLVLKSALYFSGVDLPYFTQILPQRSTIRLQSQTAVRRESEGAPLKSGEARVLWGLHADYPALALAGLGSQKAAYNDVELIDDARENARIAAAAGCKALKSSGIAAICVESLGQAKSTAEGANLSVYKYQGSKTADKRKPDVAVDLYKGTEEEKCQFEEGRIGASAQNLARTLMETPANHLTPNKFAERAAQELEEYGVNVTVRDRKWAETMKMGCFLSVAQGSDVDPAFVEARYTHPERKGGKPIVIVGKGVTFDSGGISLKQAANMAEMRGDMGGAAVSIATLRAIAQLKRRTDIVVLTPLTENMPGGRATKPGDIFTAMNGKSVCVDNTDAEGRLILADALCYAAQFDPCCIVDLATLTGAIRVALGDCAVGAFTPDHRLFNAIENVAKETGDRIWRLPLWKTHAKRMTGFSYVDVHNMGKGKGAGSSTAAAFLQQFVPSGVPWMHLDIAGVMNSTEDQPYLNKGMTGRPTRTLLELVSNVNLNQD